MLLLAGAAAAQAGRIEGTVLDAKGEPVEGAYVLARAGEPPEIVAQARTDGNGLYTLEAPAGLMTLAVMARGHYVISAGGLEADTITQSCAAEGPCAEVDFRLGQPGVVEGWLTDRFGDPVSRVRLQLELADALAPTRPGAVGTKIRGTAVSDDRGYFRIWNLRPGRYVLRSDPRMWPFQDLSPNFVLPPQQVDIREQAETVKLLLSVDSDHTLHTISGLIEGRAIDKDNPAVIAIQQRSNDRRMQSMSHHLLRGERFSISGLKTGDYVLRLSGGKPAQNSGDYQLLGEIHVDRDINDLRLAPSTGAGIRLKVDFAGMQPRNVNVLLASTDSSFRQTFQLRSPDYEAAQEGLAPGEYELSTFSNEYYLVQPHRLTLSNGQILSMTAELGNEFASLRGKVRVAAGAQRAAASHFTVGARGPQGRYKRQADEDGRFEFEKLPPGSYRIAAWAKLDIDVEDDGVWSDASGAADVEVEPGFDVEMDVTAVP